MTRFISILALFAALLHVACQNTNSGSEGQSSPGEIAKPILVAPYGTPVLDGSGSDDPWEATEWLPINQTWAGAIPDPNDFSGRFKLAWDENNLYILAETTDDVLFDVNSQALDHFWDDDCLVVFLDEDTSGGEHEFNYNAFAYHIALDGRVADIAPDSSFRYYNDHCLARRIARDNVNTWEVAVRVFAGKQYKDGGDNVPLLLKRGKKVGLAIAYCDNDHSPERESFIGNITLPNAEKTRKWLNADAYCTLELR